VESIDVDQKIFQFFLAMGPDEKISSTYLNQHAGLYVASFIAFFSKSSMEEFAITEKIGESIATPSVRS
jgi:hypothetical protein